MTEMNFIACKNVVIFDRDGQMLTDTDAHVHTSQLVALFCTKDFELIGSTRCIKSWNQSVSFLWTAVWGCIVFLNNDV